MKLFLMSLVFLITSCASQTDKIENYEKDKYCSNESLEYLKSRKAPPAQTPVSPEYFNEEQQNSITRLDELEPKIRSCYADAKIKKPEVLNLCLVVGYDVKGDQEYFEFSTSQMKLPQSLKDCLNSLKDSKEFSDMRNISHSHTYKIKP